VLWLGVSPHSSSARWSALLTEVNKRRVGYTMEGVQSAKGLQTATVDGALIFGGG